LIFSFSIFITGRLWWRLHPVGKKGGCYLHFV